jgi:5'-3' exonuclease
MPAPGYEADDVMATMAVWAKRRGLAVVLVTEDKDLYQAVDEGVWVMHPRQGSLLGPQVRPQEHCVRSGSGHLEHHD